MPTPLRRVIRQHLAPVPTVQPNLPLARPAPTKAAPIATATRLGLRPTASPAQPLARPASGVRSAPGAARPGPGHNSGLSAEQQQAAEGFSQFNTDQQKVARLRERRNSRPFPFFLGKGEQGNIIILDVAPYFYHEHRWRGPDGKWNRAETCLKGTGLPCPGCQKFGREGAWIMGLTIIDLRPYTPTQGTNAGKLLRFQRKFMGVKSSVIEKYERLYKQQGNNFRGCSLTVFRSTKEKTPNTGDDFEFRRKLTEAELQRYGAEMIKVTDYQKGFAPLSPEEFKYVMGDKGDVPGGEDLAAAGEEELPFVTCSMAYEPMGVWRKAKPVL